MGSVRALATTTAIAVVASGCFRPAFDHPRCGPAGECPTGLQCQVDGVCAAAANAIDAAANATDAAAPIDGSAVLCLGTTVRVCVDRPTAPLVVSQAKIDTTIAAMCAPYATQPAVNLCVITGSSIEVASAVQVVGPLPLVLLSASTLTINGTLSVASVRGGSVGAGGSTAVCADVVTPTKGAASNDGGGGAGGSFGSRGGDGGNGADKGTAGKAGAAWSPTGLQPGCAGQAGAGLGGTFGVGGASGGVAALLAVDRMDIAGHINASGAAGSGAVSSSGGGGGGGAGGMIVLEAPIVSVTGTCFANGGGGGEGANTAADGASGSESGSPSSPGAGGSNGTIYGGDGGSGSVAGGAGANGGSGTMSGAAIGGGGGGGGGGGWIHIVASSAIGTSDATRVSPPPR